MGSIPVRHSVKRLSRRRPKDRIQQEQLGQLVVQVPLPARDHVKDNKTDASAEIGGAFRREQAALGGTIFVAGADEFNRGNQRSPALRGQELHSCAGRKGGVKNLWGGCGSPNGLF